MTARCPVCHRRQRVLVNKDAAVQAKMADHLSGSQPCSGSGAAVPDTTKVQ